MSTKVVPETRELAGLVLSSNPSNTYLPEIDQELNKAWFEEQAELEAMAALNAQQRELMTKGKAHYNALCLSCHGTDGKGAPNPAMAGTTMAPSFIGSPRVLGSKNTAIRIALDGMTGPLDGKEYPGGLMIPLKANNDDYIASVLTYIRNSFGNQADMIIPGEVASVRRDTMGRNEPYTQEQLSKIMLIANCPPNLWTVTSSHRNEQAHFLTDGDEKTQWKSHGQQSKDMWIEFEFPNQRLLNYVMLDAKHGTDFPNQYAIQYSEDGETWNHKQMVKGEKKVEHRFDQLVAIKVRISTEDPKDKWWTLYDLEISGPTEGDLEVYPIEKRSYLKAADAVSYKQSWGEPKQGKSVLGQDLKIADKPFEHGIGTHSNSEFVYELKGKGYQRFYSKCGPQGKNGKTTMTFEVHLDGNKVFDTGDMTAGDHAKYVDINITAARELKLVVTQGSDGKTDFDHANWVDTCFIR